MDRIVMAALAALAVLAPGAVVSQDASSPSLGLSGDAVETAPNDAAGAIPDLFTYDQLMADMEQADSTAAVAAIASVTEATEVSFGLASALEGGAAADVSAMAGAGSARLEAIRAAVTANAALSAKLTAAGYDVDQVLAVQPTASGSVYIYIAG